METDLTDSQAAQLRRTLTARRDELIEDIRTELVKTEDEGFIELAGRVHDSGEAAVADLLYDLDLAVIDQHLVSLREVEQALERMREGTYGVCIDCGSPIPYARLEAYPSAPRCLQDQERFEQSHAGQAHPRL